MADISGEKLVERIDFLLKQKGHNREILEGKRITKKQTISNWTSGKAPSVYTMYEIARFLGTSIDFLVTGDYPNLKNLKLSEKSLKLAWLAENLSDTGKDIALNQVEALQKVCPLV